MIVRHTPPRGDKMGQSFLAVTGFFGTSPDGQPASERHETLSFHDPRMAPPAGQTAAEPSYTNATKQGASLS